MMKHISKIMIFSVAGLTTTDGLQLQAEHAYTNTPQDGTMEEEPKPEFDEIFNQWDKKCTAQEDPPDDCQRCPECVRRSNRMKQYAELFSEQAENLSNLYDPDPARMDQTVLKEVNDNLCKIAQHCGVQISSAKKGWWNKTFDYDKLKNNIERIQNALVHCEPGEAITQVLAILKKDEEVLCGSGEVDQAQLAQVNTHLCSAANDYGLKIPSAKKGWWHKTFDKKKLKNNIKRLQDSLSGTIKKKSCFSSLTTRKLFFEDEKSWGGCYDGKFHRVCKRCYDTAEKSRKWSMTKFRYTKGFFHTSVGKLSAFVVGAVAAFWIGPALIGQGIFSGASLAGSAVVSTIKFIDFVIQIMIWSAVAKFLG